MVDYWNIEQIVSTTHDTVNKLSKYKNGDSALMLYFRYIQQRKMQDNNQTLSADAFMMKGLNRWRDKFYNAKKILVDEKLIQVIPKRNKWKIDWRYVKINFIITRVLENHSVEKPECGKTTTNTLVENINTLVKNINTIKKVEKEKVATLPLQERLKEYRDVYTAWMLYEFELYRTEANDKWKQRREFEKVFDLSKRLRTWKMRQDKFSKPKYESSIDRDKRVQQQVQTQRDLSPKYTGNAMNNLQEQVSRREQGEGSWGDDR